MPTGLHNRISLSRSTMMRHAGGKTLRDRILERERAMKAMADNYTKGGAQLDDSWRNADEEISVGDDYDLLHGYKEYKPLERKKRPVEYPTPKR